MKNLFSKTLRLPGVALGLLVVIGAVLAGCQTSNPNIQFTPVEGEGAMPGTPSSPSSPASASDPQLAKGDMVKVTFSGIDPIPLPHEEQIKDDGTITLPLINAVKAEGKTAGELQKEIHKLYVPDYYQRLTIIVTTDRRVYYVQGQVRSSGRQEYIGPTTVLKAIASAGDFTDFANRKKVVLTRADGKRLIVDCIKAAKDSVYDLPVFPGDKIEVPMRKPFSW